MDRPRTRRSLWRVSEPTAAEPEVEYLGRRSRLLRRRPPFV